METHEWTPRKYFHIKTDGIKYLCLSFWNQRNVFFILKLIVDLWTQVSLLTARVGKQTWYLMRCRVPLSDVRAEPAHSDHNLNNQQTDFNFYLMKSIERLPCCSQECHWSNQNDVTDIFKLHNKLLLDVGVCSTQPTLVGSEFSAIMCTGRGRGAHCSHHCIAFAFL